MNKITESQVGYRSVTGCLTLLLLSLLSVLPGCTLYPTAFFP